MRITESANQAVRSSSSAAAIKCSRSTSPCVADLKMRSASVALSVAACCAGRRRAHASSRISFKTMIVSGSKDTGALPAITNPFRLLGEYARSAERNVLCVTEGGGRLSRAGSGRAHCAERHKKVQFRNACDLSHSQTSLVRSNLFPRGAETLQKGWSPIRRTVERGRCGCHPQRSLFIRTATGHTKLHHFATTQAKSGKGQ